MATARPRPAPTRLRRTSTSVAIRSQRCGAASSRPALTRRRVIVHPAACARSRSAIAAPRLTYGFQQVRDVRARNAHHLAHRAGHIDVDAAAHPPGEDGAPGLELPA